MYATYGIRLGMTVFTPIAGVDHLSIHQYFSHLCDVTLVFVNFDLSQRYLDIFLQFDV